MRLLKRNNFGVVTLTEDFIEHIPQYTILSHTWGAEEVTFGEMMAGTGKSKAGYDKIRFCGEQTQRDGLEYFWVDTCCIDKSNNTELTEAINSMYRWYRNAVKCYVYLRDVSTNKPKTSNQFEFTWEPTFRDSRWFTRGWTLQELLAPSSVEFFSQEGDRLGDKRTLEKHIHDITGIAIGALQGNPLSSFSVTDRMSWATTRQTTREEDKAYSLLGIFDVYMPLIYGEGSEYAFKRLREEISKPSRASSKSLYSDNEELLNRLFCVDYRAAQTRPRRPQRGTCQWIFNDPRYNSWLNSRGPSMLMLTGKAGTGKSVLTRYLTENFLSDGRNGEQSTDVSAGINFFCSSFEAALNSETTVLQSLLHQLILLDPQCAVIIQNRLQKRTTTGLSISLKLSTMWTALLEVLSMHTMKSIFLTIDAIEELGAEVAVSILSNLWQIVQDLSLNCPESRLKIFISSRQIAAYTYSLPKLVRLPMRKSQMEKDIGAYLQAAIEDFATQNKAFSDLASSSIRLNIVAQISRIADGMFLAAALAWGDFCKGLLWNQETVARKLQRLVSIKPGMTAFYDRMIDGIDEPIRDDAFSILSILAAAAMPLSETEIGIILGISNASRKVMRSTDVQPFRYLNDMMEMHIPDFINIQEDSRVTLVHLSFKEYLESREDFHEILLSGHRNITRSCLTYLKLRDLLQDASDTRSRADLISEYPFLSYASNHFLYHIGSISYDDSSWLLFADTAAKHSVYTLESLWPKNTSYRTSPLLEILDTVPSPEIEALVRKFKEHGYDIDEKWSRHSCGRPLQHCCSWAGTDKRKERAAFLLLGLGANPNPPKKPWRSNLKRALEGNAPDLYNALLRHPLINLGDKDQRDQTLLHVLVQTAPMERICEVLDVIHDVDINVQDVNGYTPLHLAVSGGRVEVVRKLLTVSGIRLDLADKQGRTAFTLATYWGMKSMALVLIEHSQAFPVPEAGQVSALVFAAIQQEKALCFRLLEMSSYRNLHLHMDMSGKCILHHAAMNNWEDVLDSCVSLGGPALNLNQIDKSGRSALHYAAALGNVDACCVLVASGASLTLQDRNGRTAAHASADAGFKDALMVLLRSGRVNPNQRDLEGRNLVHWAATLDCVDVMEVIRDTDMPEAVELARRDKYDKMPIDIAFRCRCKHVGQFLAREMRAASNYNDIYNWDNMYRSREVLDVELQAVLAMDRQWSFVTVKEEFDMLAADKQDDRKRAQELRSHRRSRQQLEWPDKLWGIVKHKASDAEQ